MERRKGHLVILGDNRAWPVDPAEQVLRRLRSPVEAIIGGDDERLVMGDTRRREGIAIPRDPLSRSVISRVAGEEADVAMPKIEQDGGAVAGGFMFIHRDRNTAQCIGRADPRNAGPTRLEQGDERRIIAVRLSQDDAVGAQCGQGAVDLAERQFGVGVDEFEQHVIAMRLTRHHAPEQHLVDPVIAAPGTPIVDRSLAVVDRQDEEGARAAHAPGGTVGSVAEIGDGGLDPLAHCDTDVGRMVDDARNGLTRDAGRARDILDRHRLARAAEPVIDPADEPAPDPATPVDEGRPASAAEPDDGQTVIVTADRREQNLQDYAGTAAAFSGDKLKARGIQDITDMNDVLPGLTVANNGGNIEVWIRGVGSSNNTELGDPAAATHFDGVYIPRPAGIGSAFFDIQRVEVNVGPQGTLRGRNATAGSVNIISWKPGLGVLDGEVEFEAGNYDQRVVRGMINIPIGDTMAMRFSGMGLTHDSYYENVGPVRDIDVAEAEDNVAGRAQFLWKPTDRLRFLLAGDYMRETGTGYTGTNYANPLGNGIDPNDIKDPRRVIARGFTPDLDIKHQGVRLEATYETEAFTIDYLGSYRHVNSNYNAVTPISPDYEGVLDNLGRRLDQTTGDPNDFVDPAIVLRETLDNFSRFQSLTDSKSHYHELRLHNDKGPLIWSVGANYFKEDQYAFLGSTGDRGPFFQGVEFNMPDVDAKSYGVFADTTYSVTPRARLTAGIRYTDDRKSREGVAARYGFAIGDGNFGCCLGVRVGTEGFEFAGRDRTIFNPDANANGIVSDDEALAFYLNGVSQFGARDNIDDIFANGIVPGHFGTVPGVPQCFDTVTGDTLVCNGFEPSGQFTYALPFPGQIFRQSGKMRQKFVDWRLRGEYDLGDKSMIYALVTTGHKSGGFNDNLGDLGVAPTYKPEKVTLYEAGSKNIFYLGNLRTKLNGTVFYNDYKDQVLTSLLSVTQALDLSNIPGATLPPNTSGALVVAYSYNAASSAIYGANIEAGIQLPHNINFDVNALWLEAKVKKADPIQDFRYQADVEPEAAVFRSIDDKRLPRTPKYQLNATLSQAFDLKSGKFDYVVSAGYRSKQFMTIFNGEDFTPATVEKRLDDKVDGYWTFDLGAGYSHGRDGKVRFEGYINNVTNAVHEAAIIITQFDNTRFFTRPRTFGARLRVKY